MVKIPYIGNSETPISDREIIGRALDKKSTIFIYQDKNSDGVSWKDFHDNRPSNLSVDRLGINSPNKEITSSIKPVAHKRAVGRGLQFNGWITVQASKIKKYYQITPEPVLTPEDEKNLYHAGIVREGMTSKREIELWAVTLYGIFRENGSVLSISPSSKRDLNLYWNFLFSLFSKKIKKQIKK